MQKAALYLQKAFETLMLFTLFFCGLVFFTGANDPFWVTEKFFIYFSTGLLFFAFFALCIARGSFPFFKTPFDMPFALFLAANLIGVIGVMNIYSFGARVFINLCYLVIFYLVVYYGTLAKENIKKAMLAVILAGSVMAFYGLMQTSGMDFISWGNTFAGRAASTLGNPNFLAGHVLLLSPLALALFLSSKKPLVKTGLFFAAAIMIIALFATQTRGAYIGFVVAVITLVWLFVSFEKETIIKYKKAAIAAAVILLVISGLYFISNPQAIKRAGDILALKDEAANIRVALWKNSLYLIKDHFVKGSGAGNFPGLYSFYQAKSLSPEYFRDSSYYKSGHAHNDFIQFAAEYGVIGLGAMLWFFILLFDTALKYLKKQEGDRAAVIGIMAGSAGLLTHAFFNFPFQIAPTAAVFFALAAAAVSAEGMPVETAPKKRMKYIYAFLAIIFVAGFILSGRALSADAYLRKAKESAHFGRTYETVNYASEAADLNPWDDELVFYYSQALVNNNNPEKAFEMSKKVFMLNPGHWENLEYLFSQYTAKNDNKNVLDVSFNMYRISPYSDKAIMARGYALYLTAGYDEAVALYEKAMKIKGETASLLSQISAIYGAMGNVSRTLEYAARALEKDPEFADAYYNQAVAYYRMRDYKSAAKSLRSLLKILPGDKRAEGFLQKVLEDAK